VVSNSSNVVSYDATLKLVNLDINSTVTPSTGARTIKIYKTSIAAGNLLATATYNDGVAFVDTDSASTAITEATFTDVDIAPGGSVTLIVTADTQYGSTGENFSAGIEQNDVAWDDGVYFATNAANITSVDSLPIIGKTLSY